MADRKKRARSRQRNGLVEIVNGMLTLVVLGMLAVGGLFLYGAHSFYSAGPTGTGTPFLVEQGSSLGLTAERLENQGLINNRLIFQFGGMALKKQGDIKSGMFEVPAGASMADILTLITEGKAMQFRVIVPEGWTAWQVIDRLNDDTNLVGEISQMPAEGSILPGSYDYIPGATRQSVLDKMQADMTTSVAEIWATRDPNLPITTPEEMVILASIVEKETGVASERGDVASAFVNRLNKGMRLQSDPTIIYGITKGQSTLGRGLKRSEIEAKTAYNTYQIDGLPPTPIANPGVESLRAVANPNETDYVYFVAKGATPDQGHAFAATYDEHRKNVAKWREIEAQAAQQAERDAEAARLALEAEQAEEAGEDVGADAAPAEGETTTP